MTPAATILAGHNQRRLYRELAELIERHEAAAHELIPVAAQFTSTWDPDDHERRYTAEQLMLHRGDLQRLRRLLEELGIDPWEASR